MTSSLPPDRETDDFWRAYLTSGSPAELRARRIPKRPTRGSRFQLA